MGFIFGGVIKRMVFCVTGLGSLYLEGLIHGGAYFLEFYGIFHVIFTIRYITNSQLLDLQFAWLGQQIEGYQLFRRKVVLIQVVSKQVY